MILHGWMSPNSHCWPWLLAFTLAATGACGRSVEQRGEQTNTTERNASPPTSGTDESREQSSVPTDEVKAARGSTRDANTKVVQGQLGAFALHRRAIVVDTHNDVTLRLTDQPEFDFSARAADGHTDLPRIIEGGLDAQFLSVWVNPRDFRGDKAWTRSMAMFDAIHAMIQRNQEKVAFARSSLEMRAALAAGKTAFLIGVEGAHALGNFGTAEEGIARLRKWYDRGARYLTITWMNSNALGGSSGDRRGKKMGLTPLGRRVLREMNTWGMIVDVSHVSDQTFHDALATSRLPVLASHSGVRALHDHNRNISDDMLRALAKNGGAVCIVFYPGFLDQQWAAGRKEARRTGTENKAPQVTIAKVLEHIEHVVQIAGVDHVCLGSDFDGIGAAPIGLEDVSRFPNITKEMVNRGYSEEDILKILGGNVLRIMEANELGAKTEIPKALPR